LTSAGLAAADLDSHRIADDLAPERAFSTTSPPDTPPPQLIA
jgi:hypothetical protein